MEKYEVKDVIFGLRSEYLKIQQLLDELEGMVALPTEKDRIYYSISKSKDEKGNKILDLKLSLLRKQSFILSMIQKLGKNVMGSNEQRVQLHNLIQGGDHGLIIVDSKDIALPEDSNEIYRLADKVLSNPLVNNAPHRISYDERYTDDVSIKREINISPLSMAVHSWEKKKNYNSTPSEFVSYLPETDILRYASYYDLAMSPLLSRCLESQVDGDSLTKVEKDIIDNSGVRDKKVTIEQQSILQENMDYNIEETHDEIRLTRKK